jgi:hypothetical protein
VAAPVGRVPRRLSLLRREALVDGDGDGDGDGDAVHGSSRAERVPAAVTSLAVVARTAT